MSEQSKRYWRGGARAATGVVAIGVAVAVAVVLGTGIVPVPAVERGVVSVEVDTSQNATYSLVCTGAFGELGADPSRPTDAVTSGTSQVIATGSEFTESELQREHADGTAPRVFESPAKQLVAAAETQTVATSTLQGLSASACAEPTHEQWLVGGATGLGQSATVVLGNPYEVPATVQITLYDQDGQTAASTTAGVLVPANSQRIVSLNGYLPNRDSLVARIDSTGAAVTAAMGVSQTVDIRSFAVDTVTRQLAPQTNLVFAGIINVSSHTHTADEAVGDDFPVVVRVLAPGDDSGSATVTALMPDGTREELGTFEFEHGKVTEFEVLTWPETAQAIAVDSDTPIVGGVFSTVDIAPAHDYAWFSPAPTMPTHTEVPVSVVPGGQLVLVNPGTTAATVTLRPDDGVGDETVVEVPAGAAVTTEAREQSWMTTTAPISAGVRLLNGAFVASYPVLAPAEPATSLTVYPR